MSDTMYKYVKQSNGIICMQIDRPPLSQISDLKYSISYCFCSKEDVNKFSKSKARSILNSRMKHKYCISFNSNLRINSKDLISLGLKNLCNGDIKTSNTTIKVPNWAR